MMKRFLAFLLALLFAFPAFAEEAPLLGEITEADKHGNVATSLPASELLARCALGDLLTITLGEQRITAPLVGRYSDVNVGEPLVFQNSEGQVAFAINHQSFQEVYGAQPGTSFELALLQAGGYLEQYEIRNLVKSESREDYATDEVFANFRPVIDGVLYRGASPVLQDDARAPYAMTLVKAAGIKTVVNLAQTGDELPTSPDPYDGMAYIAVGMSADVQSADFAPALAAAMGFMLEREAPYYIHCNEGKDRAGIVCALLEALLGFTPEQIVEDYMLSYQNYYGVEAGTEKYALLAQQIETIMETLLGAPMDANTLQARAEAYFAEALDVSPDDMRAALSR